MKSSTIKFLIFIPIVLLVLLGAALMIDDPLSESSKSMLSKADSWKGQKSEPFLYFLGMSAPIGQDPIKEGKIILEEIRSFEEKYGTLESSDPFEKVTFELSKRVTLDLPDFKFDCPFDDIKCLEKIISEVDLDEKNLVELKSRYLNFLKMDGFRFLTRPHLSAPSPSFANLMLANKLVLLSVYKEATQGRAQTSIRELFLLMKRLSVFTKNIDDFVGKIVSYSLINTTIDVLFLLVRTFNEKGERLSPLSKEVLSFEKAFVREFAASIHLTKSLYDSSILYRFLLKKNMTINASTVIYESIIWNSEKSAVEFLAAREKNNLPEIENAWLRNSAGTTLLQIAQPDFNRFVEAGFDLNAKIRLFNGVLGKQINAKTLKNIKNPYYKSGHPPEIHEGRICFLSPPREDNNFCLKMVTDAAKIKEEPKPLHDGQAPE